MFTYCPDDIVVDDATTSEVRVNWDRPTATDNSDEQPSIICSKQSGSVFSVPASYEVQCNAVDGAGNKATCSFRITLTSKYTAALKLCANAWCSHSIANQTVK